MQGEGGFVRDYRSTIDWEWFTDVNTAHLWEYIRLRVNYEPSRFRGMEIKRGEMLESVATISAKTGLTAQNVRTALSHLKSTGEITCKPTRYGMHICAVKYAFFQGQASDANRKVTRNDGGNLTTKSQRSNKEVTTYKEYKEIKEEKEKKNVVGADAPMTPPTPQQVEEYGKEIGYEIDGQHFCDYYSARGWSLSKGMPMKDWKATIRNWKRKETKQETQNEKHDGNIKRERFNFDERVDFLDDSREE